MAVQRPSMVRSAAFHRSLRLGEGVLDRIEVGTVGRRPKQFRADCLDESTNPRPCGWTGVHNPRCRLSRAPLWSPKITANKSATFASTRRPKNMSTCSPPASSMVIRAVLQGAASAAGPRRHRGYDRRSSQAGVRASRRWNSICAACRELRSPRGRGQIVSIAESFRRAEDK